MEFGSPLRGTDQAFWDSIGTDEKAMACYAETIDVAPLGARANITHAPRCYHPGDVAKLL